MASAAVATALASLATALPTVSAWMLSALSSAFFAVRLGLYVLLVCVAWLRIIEEDDGGAYSSVLSASTLRQHDDAAPQRGGRQGASPSSEASLEESMDDWFEGSIVTETAASDYGPNSADAPTTPSTAAGLKVAAEPPPHEEHVSTAKAVLPTEVAAVAEDEEEKQVLTGAALAGGGGLAAAGRQAVESGIVKPSKQGRRSKKQKKKPWLNRQLEGLFKPVSEKYNAAGFMMYRGFNRAGKRIERSAAILGKHLDGSIRDVGASAVGEVERLLKKWIKFGGAVALLTVCLLPLPNVHVTITAGAD
ncbi:hypothetical protein D9Q98_000371 [Chlorella vulgaris]|uniref:Uncharacterized protein n=1 Tax=Chlorella vulgaris TaxID=3077 RepID=A0A9D4TY81_CHLVU|nr:hypothetical protein D9Q98_000371 [Chlorella vulgaris]